MLQDVYKRQGKKQLKQILDRCISVHGTTKTAEVLDNIKALGYKYSTIGALSVSISDMTVPKEKPEILAAAQKQVESVSYTHLDVYKRQVLRDC